jgi:hypothetical protein
MGIPKDTCHCKATKYCRTRVLVAEARCGLGMDVGVENEAKSWNPIILRRLLSWSIQPLVLMLPMTMSQICGRAIAPLANGSLPGFLD